MTFIQEKSEQNPVYVAEFSSPIAWRRQLHLCGPRVYQQHVFAVGTDMHTYINSTYTHKYTCQPASSTQAENTAFTQVLTASFCSPLWLTQMKWEICICICIYKVGIPPVAEPRQSPVNNLWFCAGTVAHQQPLRPKAPCYWLVQTPLIQISTHTQKHSSHSCLQPLLPLAPKPLALLAPTWPYDPWSHSSCWHLDTHTYTRRGK